MRKISLVEDPAVRPETFLGKIKNHDHYFLILRIGSDLFFNADSESTHMIVKLSLHNPVARAARALASKRAARRAKGYTGLATHMT